MAANQPKTFGTGAAMGSTHWNRAVPAILSSGNHSGVPFHGWNVQSLVLVCRQLKRGSQIGAFKSAAHRQLGRDSWHLPLAYGS